MTRFAVNALIYSLKERCYGLQPLTIKQSKGWYFKAGIGVQMNMENSISGATGGLLFLIRLKFKVDH